ncbi:MAG TPA: cytochrome c3 family protein [Vicinamibacterales bacterium]|nr:cytochrome c3 family protein [Vicinamibacterales bacterium]
MRCWSGGLKACAARVARVVPPFGAACVATLVIVAAACGSQGQVSDDVFTPAHRSFGSAARDYFNIRPTAQQPIPFPHKTHLAKGAECTDCHETVERGPVAGIPSVKTCMVCHSQIATNRPLIKEVTAYSDKGIDIPWQRVYGFSQEAHVRFNHAPHIRAKVECATCHGDMKQQTVAERKVDHTMGFCVNCHRQNNASNDCLTCHF